MVVGYSLTDQNGFHARTSLAELHTFASKLAQHLDREA